ncbi:MAG: cyclic nucleotide-binding domain-containing protein [Acidimicrobiia bacterium]|nr:MAG: cyclic nucleotide-binding domain-containing protein [Acidimicrobiia bacterium]
MDASVLRTVPLFAGLSDSDRRQVARWMDQIEVGAGTPLAREGDFAYEFFLIEEGTAEVTHDGAVVTVMGPGEYFGEIALLDTRRRTASVTASTPMRLIVMFKREFQSMADAHPEIADAIRAAGKERLERTS